MQKNVNFRCKLQSAFMKMSVENYLNQLPKVLGHIELIMIHEEACLPALADGFGNSVNGLFREEQGKQRLETGESFCL